MGGALHKTHPMFGKPPTLKRVASIRRRMGRADKLLLAILLLGRVGSTFTPIAVVEALLGPLANAALTTPRMSSSLSQAFIAQPSRASRLQTPLGGPHRFSVRSAPMYGHLHVQDRKDRA